MAVLALSGSLGLSTSFSNLPLRSGRLLLSFEMLESESCELNFWVTAFRHGNGGLDSKHFTLLYFGLVHHRACLGHLGLPVSGGMTCWQEYRWRLRYQQLQSAIQYNTILAYLLLIPNS
jgi:hypothetical protein